MDKKLKVFIAAPCELAQKAAKKSFPVSLMAYRFGQGFHLYSSELPKVQCALMDIDCRGFNGRGPHRLLVNEVLAECERRGYEGIVLDIPSPSPLILDFCGLMTKAAAEKGLRLYLPVHSCRPGGGATALISSFVTDTSLEARLRRAVRIFGAGNIALVTQHIRREFTIPDKSYSGRATTGLPRNRRLLFSKELCTKYLTFFSSGQLRIVLWDDNGTRERKLALAESLGVKEAFVYFPTLEK